MSEDKKESIGFKTPAKTIEEQYDAIFQMLESRSKDWSKMRIAMEQYATDISATADQASRAGNAQIALEAHSILIQFFCGAKICELGEQLNDIAKHLTRLEKKLAPEK